jgi:septum formation protein
VTTLILASASAVRARLLREAGVAFGVRTPGVDEAVLKEKLRGSGAEEVAGALAEAKALDVSAACPGAWVLGCDQVLVCDSRLFDKAHDGEEARRTLAFLRGKTHHLVSAAVLVENGTPVWRHVERAALKMRDFSDEFLDSYLKTEGKLVLGAVGCYHLEGRGSQLFETVSGDFFCVLGLPLLPLLAALREKGILKT